MPTPNHPTPLDLDCTLDGLFLAGVPLLRRTREGLVPRSERRLRKLLRVAYPGHGDAVELGPISAVANALNQRALGRAQIAATFFRLPPLDHDRAVRLRQLEDDLEKYDPDQARDDHGRWTSEGGFPNAVPAYRRGVVSAADWARYGRLVRNDPAVGIKGEYVLGQIFAGEGGFATDPLNGATSGITRTTLGDAIKQQVVPAWDSNGNLMTPARLTDQQIVDVQAWYLGQAYRRVGGIDAVEQFDDAHTAAAVTDALYMSGASGGTRQLQTALNSVLATMTPDERANFDVPDSVKVDGRMGPATFAALTNVANSSGERNQQFRDALADLRPARNRGERIRIDQFR